MKKEYRTKREETFLIKLLTSDKEKFIMNNIKASLAGLVGVSLCMANISGIVTDSAGGGIAGAVIKLEKGGQMDTSESNGNFTLVVGSTGILPGNGKLLPNGLSARMSGNFITVSIAERSAIEIATFDLSGKAFSTVRKTLDAGSHSISLPYQGAGIYLYKVKSGNSEFVQKGNSVNCVSSGSSATSQGSSSKPLAKQALSTAAINDVIAATKTGNLNYRVVVTNSDTSGIAIKMIASAGTVTDANGNVYQTVKIGNQVWMVENLRVTKYNDGSAIPLDTSAVTWNNATTPKYCFYNNTTDSGSIKKYGALYNWYVVNPANPKKIAPAGWHVPSNSELTVLEKYLVLNGYNWDGTRDTTQGNKIAKSLAAKTDWYTYSTTGVIGNNLTENNSRGFSALPGGSRCGVGDFNGQSGNGSWWSATEYNAADAWNRHLYYSSDYLDRDYGFKSCGFSVRLLRD